MLHDETRMLTAASPLGRVRMRAQGVVGQLKRFLNFQVDDFERARPGGPTPGLAKAIGRLVGGVAAGMDGITGTAIGPSVRAAGGGGGAAAGYAGGGEGGDVNGVVMVAAPQVIYYAPEQVQQVADLAKQQTQDLKKAATTDSEKATIEIVALMFQSILAEERIPSGVRVWFARLQMPVLRLALGEPDFFDSLQHPARKLIDRMGSCVMGFDGGGLGGGELEAEIKRVVQVIEQYPETGRRVFELVAKEFEKFLSKFLSEQGTARQIVSMAQQVEQKEAMLVQYTIELRQVIDKMPVADTIREFMFKVWAEVLAVSSVKHGPKAEMTLSLKKLASELVWAAAAKPNRQERAKVIQDLPGLLQRLRTGMAMIGFDAPKQDERIKVISETLAQAFMSKTEAIDRKAVEAMGAHLENLEDYFEDDAVGDLPLDNETVEMMIGMDASNLVVIADGGTRASEAMMGWARELEIGAWFTLDHNGAAANVQFAWRSERGHLHLFASTIGRSYLIQFGRLGAYLQAGLLLPMEEDTLMVRATRNAMTKLDANPERLLSHSSA